MRLPGWWWLAALAAVIVLGIVLLAVVAPGEARAPAGEDPGGDPAPQCDPALPSRLSPVPHAYEVAGTEYGSLGGGGSYDVLACRACGRIAYEPLPD